MSWFAVQAGRYACKKRREKPGCGWHDSAAEGRKLEAGVMAPLAPVRLALIWTQAFLLLKNLFDPSHHATGQAHLDSVRMGW